LFLVAAAQDSTIMAGKYLCSAAVLLLCASMVLSQPSFWVNTGNGCTNASLGDCVPCTTSTGETMYIQPYRFTHGRLGYGVNSDSTCQTQSEFYYQPPTPCGALQACQASPSDFTVFDVTSESQIAFTAFGDNSLGYVFLNITTAATVGTIDAFVYSNEEGDRLRFITTYDDGTYLTNVGLCSFGAWCDIGGFTFRASSVSLASDMSDTHALLNLAMRNERAGEDPFVILEVGATYTISTIGADLIAVGEYGPAVSSGSLSNIIASVPPHVTVSHMQLKNYETPEPALVAQVSFRDFESYVNVECDHWGELSNGVPVVDCEFSFSLSFDLSNFFSDFFFSASFDLSLDDMAEGNMGFEDVAWDEQPTFALFE